MAQTLPTALNSSTAVGAAATLRGALALCAAILAGTPERLSRLRRLDAQSDADLARSGRTRDGETRRIFGDWFDF